MFILTEPQAWPFGAALALMVGLTVIEGVGMLLASSPSELLDNLMPAPPDGHDGALGWLQVCRVPILVLLILFLAGFALAGYVVQAVVLAMFGALMPAWLASIPALFAGLSTTRGIGALIARIVPGDETSAVSEQSLIGRSGVVVQGIAKEGWAAEAKVRDAHGHMHYVMVEPDLPEQTFEQGAAILLVRKTGARFRCIANPHPELL